MRIIAGKWRSRRIVRPKTSVTRPMPDRAREATFSILGSYFGCPGELPPLPAADVFAGGGSMGLEALSRGAAACCFYERDRMALRALRKNIEALDVGSAATVVTGDAWSGAFRDRGGAPFELVFLDPPYADSDDASEAGHVWRYLRELAGAGQESTLVVLHHRSAVEYGTIHDARWRIVVGRRFGTSTLTFFEAG